MRAALLLALAILAGCVERKVGEWYIGEAVKSGGLGVCGEFITQNGSQGVLKVGSDYILVTAMSIHPVPNCEG